MGLYAFYKHLQYHTVLAPEKTRSYGLDQNVTDEVGLALRRSHYIKQSCTYALPGRVEDKPLSIS